MTDKTADGDRLPETLMLIDFDNSGWGYRAWDIDYYFSKWNDWPSQAVMEDFAQVYVAEFNSDSSNSLTVEELIRELRLHQPYLLLEQMMFYYSFLGGYQSPAHYRAYCDVIQNYFNRSGTDSQSYLILFQIFKYLFKYSNTFISFKAYQKFCINYYSSIQVVYK